MNKTFSSIVYGDSIANQLHNNALYSEAFDHDSVYRCWNAFYDRIEYLEDICEYVKVTPDIDNEYEFFDNYEKV